MSSAQRQINRNDVHIALICALPIEASCLLPLFDKSWNAQIQHIQKPPGDLNHYTIGVIEQHNVVLAHMPGMGTVAASNVAATLNSSFPNIRLTLVVGICGGMPLTPNKTEIILGDVIVSESLVQYDFGRLYPYGFQRKHGAEDTLGRQSPSIRAFLAKLKTDACQERLSSATCRHLKELNQRLPPTKDLGPQADKLFSPSYLHKHRKPAKCKECNQSDSTICSAATDLSCTDLGCDDAELIPRSRLLVSPKSDLRRKPVVHFGRVGSGNTVMKSGLDRDRLANIDSIIALEMEGAGIWEYLPTIVVKGVCDYADSHKNKGWQRYAAATAAACVKAMLIEWAVEEAATIGLPKSSLMPYTKCTNHIERTSYMLKLHDFFDGWTNGPRRFILWGLGGVGKTQIALSYAMTQMPSLQVFWIRADKIENFLIDYRKVLELLNNEVFLSMPPNDPTTTFRVTLTELEKDVSSWLIVLDNADDIDDFRMQRMDRLCLGEYLPRAGRIVVTTRDSRFLGELAGVDHGVEVRSMNSKEAELLLKGSIPIGLRNDDAESLQTSVSELLEQLGNLPLAIAQAAANMRYLHVPLSEFVHLYRERRSRMELLDQPVHDPRLPPQSVLVTWQMSFEHVQKSNSAAAELLGYLGFFHWRNIPGQLLRLLPEFNHCSEIAFSRITACLLRLSLMEKSDTDVFQIHPLVHYWLTARLDPEGRNRYLQPVLNMFSSVFPVEFEGEKSLAAFLSPHAIEVIDQAQEIKLANVACARLLQLVADFLSRVGVLGVAVQLITRALHIGLEVCNPNDVSLIYLRKYQGRIHQRAANDVAAALDFRRCLEDLKSVDACEEEIVKERYHILQDLIRSLRELEKFEEVGEALKSLEIARVAMMLEHDLEKNAVSALKIMDKHNHSHNLMRRDLLDEAEPLNEEVLRLAENEGKHLVSEPLYLIFLNCRANILRKRGRELEALAIFTNVYRRSLEVLDIECIDLWVAALNVANTLLELKKWDELEKALDPLLKAIFSGKLQGAFAQKGMKIVNGVAIAKQRLGKYEEAEMLHLEALRLCVRLMDLWQTDDTALNDVDQQSNSKLQHPNYYIYIYNVCLVIARQGRLDEMNRWREHFRDEMTKAENQFKPIEKRLEQDQEEQQLYNEARERFTREGNEATKSPWWIENKSKIEIAEWRHGRLVHTESPDSAPTGQLEATTPENAISAGDSSTYVLHSSTSSTNNPAKSDIPPTQDTMVAVVKKDHRKSSLPILTKIRTGFRRYRTKREQSQSRD